MSRIVFAHCASCHRDGGTAFGLLTYEEARPWAKAIKEEVLNRRMPPWNAVKGFGSFQHDRGLTQETLELVADWVEGGAPEGDPKLMPPAPRFDGKLESSPSSSGPEVIVDGRLKLTRPLVLSGIRAKTLLEGSSVQVIAQKPDGEIEPLVWFYEYQPKFDRAYIYEHPMRLPAGTVIQASPPASGTIALLPARLLTASPKPAR